MANSNSANVIRVDTSAAFTVGQEISAIKYIGAASGTASVKLGSSSGATLWEEAGASNVYNSNLHIRAGGQGIYVTVANSAVVYIYLK